MNMNVPTVISTHTDTPTIDKTASWEFSKRRNLESPGWSNVETFLGFLENEKRNLLLDGNPPFKVSDTELSSCVLVVCTSTVLSLVSFGYELVVVFTPMITCIVGFVTLVATEWTERVLFLQSKTNVTHEPVQRISERWVPLSEKDLWSVE
jgi:hypothetical protein